jgi:alpha-tubulin suppressor-like RCC1 family protein
VRKKEIIVVAAGYSHLLAMTRSGAVVAWGANESGQTNVPTDLRDVVAVAAGVGHSLAVTRSGAVVAWGEYTTLPTRFVGINDLTQIAANGANLIALRRDGTVVQDYFGDPTDVPLDIRASL